MCTYITAVIAADADEAAIRQCADQWGHGWKAIDNRHVLGQLRPGERYYLTTRGHCDCGTALGSMGPEWEHRSKDPANKVPALRRKGWSEAKITRWLKDKERAAGHRQRTEALHADHPPMPDPHPRRSRSLLLWRLDLPERGELRARERSLGDTRPGERGAVLRLALHESPRLPRHDVPEDVGADAADR